MKKLSALLLLLFIVGSQLVTAGPGDPAKLAARATQLTRQMAQKTPLNEGQYVKVHQLNLQLLAGIQAAQIRFANDPAALDQELAALQSRYEWDLATILWPRQMVAFKQAKADMLAFGSR